MCVPSHHDGLFFLRTLPAVFGLRFLHGAIFGVTSTAAAAVAALVLPLSRKGEGIGYFALSTNLAMVVGPSLDFFSCSIGDHPRSFSF